MKKIIAILLALLTLVSCGAPADTTVDSTTDAPDVTDAPKELPSDEPSDVAGVAPSGDGKYKINFEIRFDCNFGFCAFGCWHSHRGVIFKNH